MQLRIDKATLLAVMECMAVRDVRYYICGICFLPDGKVAGTDGHMLAYGEHDNQIDHEVILSVGKLPTKAFDYAVFDTDAGIVKLLTDEEVTVGVTLCGVIDGKYPDVSRVMRNARNADEQLPSKIGFNAGYMAKLEKIAKYVNPKLPALQIQVKTACDAVICDIVNPYKTPVSVLIMPMKI